MRQLVGLLLVAATLGLPCAAAADGGRHATERTAASGTTCKTAVSASLASHDPTALTRRPAAVLWRPGSQRVTRVRVVVRRQGHLVATGNRRGALRQGSTAVRLRLHRTLRNGTYRVHVRARVSGCRGTVRVTDRWRLRSPASTRRRAVVDWSGGRPGGHEVVGFALPGIGVGEAVCRTDTQWIRVFPRAPGREVSLMNWTFKQWDGNPDHREKALREALHARGTGPDFSEGFNKFSPPEKISTGEYVALLTDRGVIGAAAPIDLAPPIGIRVTWAWNFTDPAHAHCHVAVDVTTQPPATSRSNVGSAQIVWRGDPAAAGHDDATTNLPGLGPLRLVCQAGADGQRTATLDTPRGATVTVREASQDHATRFPWGPVVVPLPNNGQVQIDVHGGGSVLLSSRWKVNDPHPSRNWCAVAAQGTRE